MSESASDEVTFSPAAIYPDLTGKVAVVTGGSKGIGAATCRALAVNGVAVAIVARTAGPVDELVSELRHDGLRAIGIAADCRDLAALRRVRDEVESELGPVDLLAPFAGGFEHFTPALEMEPEEWSEVIEANLTSTFLAVKTFVPGMVARRRGSIVTMSSVSGRFLDKTTQAAYAAAKAGVIMFTRHLAIEIGADGVRANCIAPATTASERISRLMDEDSRARAAALSPTGRLGTPQDSANATLFLLSAAASWLTGVTLDVAGGRVML